jgi:peptidoglycan/LPS O-acetylase OafA/YrhL
VAFLFVFLRHWLPATSDPRVAALFQEHAALFYDAVTSSGFGVNLFFTLSAFLICKLLLRERASTETISIKDFYIRRVLRIWPLYYTGLAVGVLYALLPMGDRNSMRPLGWFAVFLSTVEIVRHGWPNNPMYPLWSISIEEQFYLIIPGFVKYGGRKLLYALCALVLISSNIYLYYLGQIGVSDSRVSADPLVQFESFVAGILICLLLRGRTPMLLAWVRILLFSAGLASWFCAVHLIHLRFGPDSSNPGGCFLVIGNALVALGAAMMLLTFLGASASITPSWAVYLGKISYGMYVFHAVVSMAVLNLLPPAESNRALIYVGKLGLVIALTVLIAAISYRFLESRFSG